MVGMAAMGPAPIDLADRIEDPDAAREEEERVRERFVAIGNQLMHRSGSALLDEQPLADVLGDPRKRALVAELLGQAFVVAYNTIRANREGTEKVADALVEHGEIFGDEVVRPARRRSTCASPTIDLLEEATWPAI